MHESYDFSSAAILDRRESSAEMVVTTAISRGLAAEILQTR